MHKHETSTVVLVIENTHTHADSEFDQRKTRKKLKKMDFWYIKHLSTILLMHDVFVRNDTLVKWNDTLVK